MARRGHNEGSVYRRTDGRWAASITLEGRKRKTFYGKTRKDVQKQLNAALHEQKQGTLATGPQQTVKQYLEQWLEEVHKPTIRLSTYTSYRMLLNRHILPGLGRVQLQKLTPQHVQALYTRKLKEGLSAKTVKNIHGVLHKALNNAIRWGLVPRNVCDAVSVPKQVRHEIQSLNLEQAERLLEVAQGHALEGMLTLAVTTGMRIGELLALRWQDIDFQHHSLHIRRSASYVSGQRYVESEPKTAKSRRTIILPMFVSEALKQHRTRQLERRLKVGDAWQERDLVFCNRFGDYPDQSSLRDRFHRLLKDAGLPAMRIHDLRHSAATILLSMGVHPKVVQEILGHSQISMTLDIYSHILPSMQQEAMGKLDDIFRHDDLSDGTGDFQQ